MLKQFFWWQVPWIVYCILIFFLSSLSTPPDVYTFPYSDKIKHAIEYSVLVILTLRAFRKWPEGASSQYFVLAILFSIIYGASDEWHQSFVANREASLFDWTADIIGVGIGGLVYWSWKKKTMPL